MQHCKRNCQTLVWDQSTYVTPGYGSLWEHQAQFGYRTGIALALHSVGGRHFFLGVDRDAALTEPADVVKKMSADLRVFATHARESAFRFFLPQHDPKIYESLTPVELDCLRWSMDGYSAMEIGDIINLPNAAVVESLYSAMRKLDCVTKYQAVIQALRLKLIS
jgi:DNA-binding CsgD family transcriptional regulator